MNGKCRGKFCPAPAARRLGLFDTMMGGIIGSGILRNPGEVAGRSPSTGLFLNMHKIGVNSDNKR
jgi:hypothetical protein